MVASRIVEYKCWQTPSCPLKIWLDRITLTYGPLLIFPFLNLICVGCKNFKFWATFGEKGHGTKCEKCRGHYKAKYAEQRGTRIDGRIVNRQQVVAREMLLLRETVPEKTTTEDEVVVPV